MQPLNPYLRAFFRSALPAQCQPISHHVLLVPTTEVLLRSKDRETNTTYGDLAGTEEFLASHVLRVPGGGVPLGNSGSGSGNGSGNSTGRSGAKDGSGSVRESKGKAKQYSTINGRTVVIKDSFVYSNKGFRTLNQAQLLADTIFYPDAPDGQQWLVYYISRPLLGSYHATPIVPALISDEPSQERRRLLAEATADANTVGAAPPTPKKKDIKTFGELLAQFPMISRQMHNGLEKVIRDFVSVNDIPIPKPKSRRCSLSSQLSGPSISDSASSIKSSLSGTSIIHPTSIELEPEEQALRTSLETAIIAAIDLFQNVDKQQLSLLGANTELTGPAVERLIERYVTEQVHDQTLFPRVCAMRQLDDSDLSSKIRKMTDIDIAQVGVPIPDGMCGKRALATLIAKGVDAFKRMGVASSPQEMLEILLATQKALTATETSAGTNEQAVSERVAQTPLTINADVLVSMLLIVVIRSGVRHLHSRLLYMRYFIFIDEVETGEQGYALATMEAVLAHLSGGAATLRKASKRNRMLWLAVKAGDLESVQAILQPRILTGGDSTLAESPTTSNLDYSDDEGLPAGHATGDARAGVEHRSQDVSNPVTFVTTNGSLQHVFPFQKPPTPPPEPVNQRVKKHVSMASLPRSHSASSACSSRSHSRNKSVDSQASTTVESDLSVEKLAQTQDAEGNSIIMMAVDSGRSDALRLLLRMPAHFRASFILEDANNDGATLLSVAVQSGNVPVTDEIIQYLGSNASEEELQVYMATQDSKGRCFAHYLFHQPHLIKRFGKKLPWRLKDKLGHTPLFALCRSYDHEQYHSMVGEAMAFATAAQGDGEPLHLDDHVDSKGNTLLHIINDMALTVKLLQHCDSDVNAANDKRFTPLMVGSKYGRIDLVRALFGDPRADVTLKDIRGLTAVDLAKDDDVRNRIDDLILLSSPAGKDGRMTTVVRSFFVEDATIRLVLKSGAPNANGSITVTTCMRSVADFESLARWLAIECPASWLPSQFSLPSPFLIPSRPSRTILRDIQVRMDNFFHTLLTHGTFGTHELVWEFFLVPDIDADMLSERTHRKAETRVENVKDDYEPVTDTQGVENFVASAREQVRGITQSTKKAIRATNRQRMLANDLSDAQLMAASALSTLAFLPRHHISAFERYTKLLIPSEASPLAKLYYALHAIHSSSSAIQVATDRPTYLIGSMAQSKRAIDRSKNSISRSNRWTPNLGIFEDAKRAVEVEAWDKVAKARREMDSLGCELAYTQQTIAGELAVWQDEHVKGGRAMLRTLARETLVKERAKLEGMKRALRVLEGAARS